MPCDLRIRDLFEHNLAIKPDHSDIVICKMCHESVLKHRERDGINLTPSRSTREGDEAEQQHIIPGQQSQTRQVSTTSIGVSPSLSCTNDPMTTTTSTICESSMGFPNSTTHNNYYPSTRNQYDANAHGLNGEAGHVPRFNAIPLHPQPPVTPPPQVGGGGGGKQSESGGGGIPRLTIVPLSCFEGGVGPPQGYGCWPGGPSYNNNSNHHHHHHNQVPFCYVPQQPQVDTMTTAGGVAIPQHQQQLQSRLMQHQFMFPQGNILPILPVPKEAASLLALDGSHNKSDENNNNNNSTSHFHTTTTSNPNHAQTTHNNSQGATAAHSPLSQNPFVAVRFKREQKTYHNGGVGISLGDSVIVEADRGEHLGVVTSVANQSVGEEDSVAGKVLRIASHDEKMMIERLRKREKKAYETVAAYIVRFDVKMHLVDVEFQLDSNKVTIYYKSEKTIDFRRLQRRLFERFKCRIWMKNVQWKEKLS